ncbi:MAG: hypothetical protein J7M25_18420, partial [Deltaproteobacteria bacterium]|nr:hypothetical protein [Deltaproteobacteria bacterium]
ALPWKPALPPRAPGRRHIQSSHTTGRLSGNLIVSVAHPGTPLGQSDRLRGTPSTVLDGPHN